MHPIGTSLDAPEPWPRAVHLGLAWSLAITGAMAAYVGLGATAGLIAAGALGGAALAWRGLTYVAARDPRPAVVPAVAATVVSLGVMAELYAGDFATRIAAFDARAMIIAGYTATTFAVTGAWLAWRRHPLGEFGVWFAFGLAVVAGAAVAIAGVMTSAGGYPIGLAGGVVWAATGVIGARRWLRGDAQGGQ